MEPDFYLDRRGLASYFEKEWFDHVLKGQLPVSAEFAFGSFDPSLLYCDFNENVASFLKEKLEQAHVTPSHMLEVGSSLGRTYYEVVQRMGSIRAARLIEPSRNLASYFEQLFNVGGANRFPILKGNSELGEQMFNSDHIKTACSHVDLSLINLPFEKVSKELRKSDLVICLNVLDQCNDPLALIRFLKDATLDGGILALSCTYQWEKRYLGDMERPFDQVGDLFQEGWTLVGEANIPFQCRVNERYWKAFLPQVSLFQKGGSR